MRAAVQAKAPQIFGAGGARQGLISRVQCLCPVVGRAEGHVGRAAVQAKPPQISMQAAREEAELVMFTSIKELLDSCGMSPRQVRARPSPDF